MNASLFSLSSISGNRFRIASNAICRRWLDSTHACRMRSRPDMARMSANWTSSASVDVSIALCIEFSRLTVGSTLSLCDRFSSRNDHLVTGLPIGTFCDGALRVPSMDCWSIYARPAHDSSLLGASDFARPHFGTPTFLRELVGCSVPVLSVPKPWFPQDFSRSWPIALEFCSAHATRCMAECSVVFRVAHRKSSRFSRRASR